MNVVGICNIEKSTVYIYTEKCLYYPSPLSIKARSLSFYPIGYALFAI